MGKNGHAGKGFVAITCSIVKGKEVMELMERHRNKNQRPYCQFLFSAYMPDVEQS